MRDLEYNEEEYPMDLTTLLVIGLIIVVVVMLISRNRTMGGGPISTNRAGGVDRPSYDDPGYSSSGSFGSNDAEPAPQERSVGGTTGSARPTKDDPNYRSGGSIG
jgi:hypothetical protein